MVPRYSEASLPAASRAARSGRPEASANSSSRAWHWGLPSWRAAWLKARATAYRWTTFTSRTLVGAWSSANATAGNNTNAATAIENGDMSGSFRGAAWPSSPSCPAQDGRLASGSPRTNVGLSSGAVDALEVWRLRPRPRHPPAPPGGGGAPSRREGVRSPGAAHGAPPQRGCQGGHPRPAVARDVRLGLDPRHGGGRGANGAPGRCEEPEVPAHGARGRLRLLRRSQPGRAAGEAFGRAPQLPARLRGPRDRAAAGREPARARR